MPFNLPSLPSLRNLLDSEPQVLYPPSATNTPAPSPSKKTRMRDLPPVPDDWAEERKRRGSITAQPTQVIKRPGHRRAFSAMPSSSSSSSSLAQARPSTPTGISLPRLQTSTIRSTGQLPLGRLTEYSRNPLASSSALSLPTLNEDPTAQGHSTESGMYGARRVRRGSKSSISSNTSNISDLSSAPSPRRGLQSLPNPGPTSVPPPVSRGRGGRPTISPRSWSVVDVRPSTSSSAGEDRDGAAEEEKLRKKGLTRHSSYTRDTAPTPPSRPGLISERRMSSSQLSEVAVLASWSFPSTSDSPPKAKSHRPTASSTSSSSNSRNLSDRLRDLALIDTNTFTLGLTSQSPTPVNLGTSSTESPSRLVPRHAGAGMGFQPKLQHRYTHSSPNLNINNITTNSTSIGGNGPNNRRGLRQPTPLGQPSQLSSSPGSLLSMESDSSSGLGPISPITLSIPLPEGGKWYDLAGKAKAWSRRGSVASSLGVGGVDAQLDSRVGPKELIYRDGNEEEEEEEEDYIDFDRI